MGIDTVSNLCPVCGKTFKDKAINYGSMIFFIHEEVVPDSFVAKGPLIATRIYRCCSLVKNTGEKNRGFFCIYS
jgi:hypothetical protein